MVSAVDEITGHEAGELLGTEEEFAASKLWT